MQVLPICCDITPVHIELVWRLSGLAFFVRLLRWSHFLFYGGKTMKKANKFLSVLLLLLITISIIPTSAITTNAATTTKNFGALKWSFNDSTGALTISGSSSMIEYEHYTNYPWSQYSTKIKTINIQNGVTSVATYAFYNCDNLTSVTLGNSVKSIGYRAFSDCDFLRSITIPGCVETIGEEAFYSCDGLGNVTISNGVKAIKDYAFSRCKALSSITIPASVVSIGNGVFSTCSNLRTIKVDNNSKHYSSDTNGVLFSKDKTTLVQYPIGRTETSYSIPNSVTLIGWNAFSSSENLINVTIPNSVRIIKFGAFQYCANISKIVIPEGVVSIENAVFQGCPHLKSVTLPDSVTSIGGLAFSSCTSLKSIVIPEGISTIRGDTFYKCTSLESITIPVSVKSIAKWAFSWCDNLTDIYYAGTKTQWNGITIDESNKKYINNAKIHFNSDDTQSGGDTQPGEGTQPGGTEAKFSVTVEDFSLNYKAETTLNPKINSSLMYKVEYSSSNEAVATVDEYGVITAVGEGTAEITVKVTDASGETVKDTCKVTVAKAWWQWLIIIFLFGWIWY